MCLFELFFEICSVLKLYLKNLRFETGSFLVTSNAPGIRLHLSVKSKERGDCFLLAHSDWFFHGLVTVLRYDFSVLVKDVE